MRILTATITVCILMFLLRVGDIVVHGEEAATRDFPISSSFAEEEEKPAEAEQPAEEKKPEEAEKAETPAAEGEHGEGTVDVKAALDKAKEEADAAAEAEKSGHGEAKEGEASTKESEKAAAEGEEDKPKTIFSQTELDLLQNLSKRREELDEREKKLELRDNVLKGTEAKIEQKITELKTLKTEVEAKLALYNEHEQSKVGSLVKIYENMKPQDAARIFEEIDMGVLLDVAGRMQEKKLAPVLAKMNPKRAKDLTMALAQQKKLPTSLYPQ
ncbi:MAG: hypothetical protein IT567_03010 [Alphaproteobacteria bacterium]|nr:hypothetical protein [Alphaproteobacteria bacterium]